MSADLSMLVRTLPAIGVGAMCLGGVIWLIFRCEDSAATRSKNGKKTNEYK
jgi:hypothetical protein